MTNSIKQLAAKIGIFMGADKIDFEVEVVDDTPKDICLVISKKFAEIIKKNDVYKKIEFVVCDEKENPNSMIFACENQSENNLLTVIGGIYGKLENEFGKMEIQKNIERIQEHIKKIVKKTKAKDVLVEVSHAKNCHGRFAYKVSIRMGESAPFVFSHENPAIIMIVVDSGMKNIINRISQKIDTLL